MRGFRSTAKARPLPPRVSAGSARGNRLRARPEPARPLQARAAPSRGGAGPFKSAGTAGLRRADVAATPARAFKVERAAGEDK